MLNELISKGLLTSDVVDDASKRARNMMGSFKSKYVDYELLDVFQEVFSDDGHFVEQLHAARKDSNITKRFRNGEVMVEQFNHFEGAEVRNFTWNRNFIAASQMLIDSLQLKGKLRPLHFNSAEELRDSFSNKNSSAGIIYTGSKLDNYVDIFKSFNQLKTLIAQNEAPKIPALSFHRAQISNYVVDGVVNSDNIKYKDRLVWCIDAATVSVESQFAKPLIDHFSKHVNWYAGGKDPISLRSLIRAGVVSVGKWYSLDFSLFDQTVPSWLIKHCFYLIRECLELSDEERLELDWVENNFIHTSILLPTQEVKTKHKGIPSGSNFTQLIGSMANFLVIMTYLNHILNDSDQMKFTKVCENLGGNPEDLKCFIMGDDNLFFSHLDIDLNDLSGYVANNFGMTIHPDKTDSYKTAGKFPLFLKREWKLGGEYRDVLNMAINVIHPERPRTYEGYSAWHILYGLYVTFQYSFRDHIYEKEIVDRMNENGSLATLETLSVNDLPGSLRILGDKAPKILFERAKALVRD